MPTHKTTVPTIGVLFIVARGSGDFGRLLLLPLHDTNYLSVVAAHELLESHAYRGKIVLGNKSSRGDTQATGLVGTTDKARSSVVPDRRRAQAPVWS
ncbi:MAG: hypothetical protein OEO77_00990 [Acidimicrobiia bacterium]|nr:hypothetical protein [Acidimicrobiia bacterium]